MGWFSKLVKKAKKGLGRIGKAVGRAAKKVGKAVVKDAKWVGKNWKPLLTTAAGVVTGNPYAIGAGAIGLFSGSGSVPQVGGASDTFGVQASTSSFAGNLSTQFQGTSVGQMAVNGYMNYNKYSNKIGGYSNFGGSKPTRPSYPYPIQPAQQSMGFGQKIGISMSRIPSLSEVFNVTGMSGNYRLVRA